jgi:D-serine deaminase-like pyridoxal phosphate-dependent protein
VLVPDELVTPCAVIDLDVVDANIARMARHAGALGAALRPHAKTHKCLPIAARQLAAGAAGLTVATVGEAEIFAQVCADLFIAYPLWVDADRGARLRALREKVRLSVGVDSVDGAAMLARRVGPGVEVLVEIDCGHRRSGVDPRNAGEVAVAAAQVGLDVRGVFTFPGHSYAPGAAKAAALDEAAALRVGAAALARAGVPATVRSGGSTPSAAQTCPGDVTELRPGVYVFGDAQQLELGSATSADIGLVVVATVVSRYAERVILDAGSKILGADRPTWADGFGRVFDADDARVVALSEHHATLSWPGEPPELGARVAVIPNHVCATVNLCDELLVMRGAAVLDRWPVAARGANS